MANRRRQVRLLRLAAVLTGGALGLWITVGATLAQVTARTAPAASMTLWPVAAAPRADQAALALTITPTPETLRASRAQALAALLREPVNVTAARVAALTSPDLPTTRRLLDYAQGLSRRDLQTQMALIELAVKDGNVSRALHHYDIALRTGDLADQLLMPVLVSASHNQAVAGSLVPMLRARPPWRLRFVYSLLVDRPWSTTFVPLVRAARLSPDEPQEQDFLRRALTGLVANGDTAAAARLYADAAHQLPSAGVRNGDFARDNRLPPFDWDLVDEPDFGARVEPIDDAGGATMLSLISESGRRGVVARQLMLLGSGAHVLRFRAGAVPADPGAAPTVAITCNDAGRPNQRILATVNIPAAPAAGTTITARVAVPMGCPAQWLTISAGALDAPSDAYPWVGGFAIGPA